MLFLAGKHSKELRKEGSLENLTEERIRGKSKVWGLHDWKAVPPLGDTEGVRDGAVFGGKGQEYRSGHG